MGEKMVAYEQNAISRRKQIKVRKKTLTISITCIDERIAPRPHYISFRVPGACVFPRNNEPSYTLAAILFFNEIAKEYIDVKMTIADHGNLKEQGYTDCGMLGKRKTIESLKGEMEAKTPLTGKEIENYLEKLANKDLEKLGGIGQHAKWEIEQFEKIKTIFPIDFQLGRILPNDSEREKIANKRLVIIPPYIKQDGLLANNDETGQSFDGSTIIQTIAGLPEFQQDDNITNGLLIFGYEKGNQIKEIIILEPAAEIFEVEVTRAFLQKIQKTLDLTIKKISEKIAEIAKMEKNECYRYLNSIKESAKINLYSSDKERTERAKKIAKEINELRLLPREINIKFGLVGLDGKIKENSMRELNI